MSTNVNSDRTNEEKLPFKTPFSWFKDWFELAKHKIKKDPNAMTLATQDPLGQLSIRVVLLKEWDERGFVFYTNSTSRKGKAMSHNSNVALCFYWPSIDKQIRISGKIEKISDEDSNTYFASRALKSRLGAWASHQSQPLKNRMELLKRVAALGLKYGTRVPRPEYWYGYRVVPEEIEFWSAGDFRLHDRWRWTLDPQNNWIATRLNP